MIVIFLPSILLADAENIFKENSKAVVVIISYDSEGNPIGQGSGFVVREDGVIVTNYHVISNAADIKINAGGKIFEVKGFLHIDKENDVVMLKVDAKGLLTVKIGDISKANIGEKVYVISSPQGLENTISDGILSGIREITSKRKVLQITSPISEGSSGGPVFNKNGEVIGIATFIIKEAQNLNFAMPVNLISNKISSKNIIALKDAGIIDYTKTAEYWFNLGYYYVEAGLYDDAIEAYTSAIALTPNLANPYYNRGVAYAKKGQYDMAIENYNKAIALDPNDAAAYYNRGNAYVYKGQHDRAIENFNKAIALDPNLALAYLGRGFVYDNKGQYDRAIEDYSKAIALEPNNFLAYSNRGNAYDNKGQHDRAIEDYNKAIAIDPNYAAAYNNRGNAYDNKGQHDRAIEDYNKAIAIDPNLAQAYNNRGLAYYNKGQYDRAIEDYNKAIALNPNYAQAYYNRGNAYFLSGNMGRAISDFQKACDMGNENGCKGLKIALENR